MDIYDPATDTWELGASVPDSFSMSATKFQKIGGNRLVALGGVTEGVGYVAVYDYAANTWTSAPNTGFRFNGGTAVELNDGRVIYAYGNTEAETDSFWIQFFPYGHTVMTLGGGTPPYSLSEGHAADFFRISGDLNQWLYFPSTAGSHTFQFEDAVGRRSEPKTHTIEAD